MSGNLGKASGGLKAFGDNVAQAGTKLTMLTAPLAAAGAVGVKMALDLDTAMRNIQSISKQTDEEIAALSDAFIDMSTDITKTTDSAQNLANAFYEIQGSGFAGEDAMLVLESATKAATAGLTETATAATGMTAVINSYGMAAQDAAHVSDLMFQTVNLGVGSFEQLSSSMSNVVGMANAAGVPFETVSAAMATMSKQGMSFSEASVSLNAALSDLIKPTSDGAKIIADMGFASGEAMIAALGFDGALQAVAAHTGGSVTEMSKLFSSIRGLRGALALTGDGAAMFASDLEAMANATGATQEAFAIQMKSFEAQFKNFQNNMNAMLIEIGQILLPIINDFLQNFLLPMIQAFRGLPEPVQKFIVVLGMIITVLGPLLVIIGSVISAIGTIGAALTAVGGAAGIAAAGATAFGAVLAVLTSPITIIVAALGVLGVALVKLFQDQRVKDIPKVWSENFRMLGEIVGLLADKAKVAGGNFVAGFINGMKAKFQEAVKTVIDLAMKVHNGIKNVLKIKSPSKVMMKLGEQVTAGFSQGIEKFGGIGVSMPQLAGASVSSASPTGASMGGSGGGVTIIIQNLSVPLAENKAQIKYIADELGKLVKLRGGN